ncbi:hypothetical protein D9619_012065 [Psilocybe cf. subviscida]|uniref:Uncharacterized protein n=1 Tax=Psilocybe cf. subviscida TaxID=2480587 RepID=A0A8H5EZQ3_9AGAR|nr:hypothetical protein D9619_012065 [Psilocybe cf. subviscida]
MTATTWRDIKVLRELTDFGGLKDFDEADSDYASPRPSDSAAPILISDGGSALTSAHPPHPGHPHTHAPLLLHVYHDPLYDPCYNSPPELEHHYPHNPHYAPLHAPPPIGKRPSGAGQAEPGGAGACVWWAATYFFFLGVHAWAGAFAPAAATTAPHMEAQCTTASLEAAGLHRTQIPGRGSVSASVNGMSSAQYTLRRHNLTSALRTAMPCASVTLRHFTRSQVLSHTCAAYMDVCAYCSRRHSSSIQPDSGLCIWVQSVRGSP